VSILAETLSIRPRPGGDLLLQVVEALSAAPCLLVIDNVEHHPCDQSGKIPGRSYGCRGEPTYPCC